MVGSKSGTTVKNMCDYEIESTEIKNEEIPSSFQYWS